ncbi:UNVERIFIED_CONTAM: hypothetical protein Cloal_2207 [Acetivibrio alkalicellulosi]
MKNYNEVLRDISVGGRGESAIRLKDSLKLFSKLSQGEQSGKDKGWMTIEEVEAELGIENV